MASVTQSPHWETVGKAKKSGKSQIPHLTRNEKKQFIDNMPRIEANKPLKESVTMYDAFLEKERREELKASRSHEKSSPSSRDQNGKAGGDRKTVQSKKRKPDQDKKKQVDYAEAIAAITKEDVKSTLTLTQTRFPDNREVWLKDLASFLNLELENVPESDPVFTNKPKDFPLCHLDRKCQQPITAVIRQASQDTMEHMFYHCVNTMLTELNKGHSTLGYRIFIQLLVKVRPDVALSKLPQFLELLKTNQNRSSRCLTILWSLGQCGHFDLKCGLRMWIEVMQPTLKVRPVANYCVDYLEELLEDKKTLSSVYGVITVREYFYLLDLIFGDRQMPGDLSRKLQTIYPDIKMIVYGGTTANMRNLFPSYLTRVTTSTSRLMMTELMSSLAYCLSSDEQCYSVWVQMYTKYIQQSSMLMQHLLDTWNTSSKTLDKKLLKKTLRSFSITNDELASKGKSSIEGLEQCSIVCKELQQKLDQARFPWGWLMFFFVSLVTAIVAYDIYFSSSIKASRTMQFLEDYGILGFTEQVWGRVHLYTSMAYGWVCVNVPLYYGKVQASVGPFMWQAWTRLLQFWNQFLEFSAPFRLWASLKLSQCLDWIHELSPDLWTQLWNYVWLSWDFFRDYSFWICGQMANLLYLAYHWVEENIILSDYTPDSVQKALTSGISSLHLASSSLFTWCQQTILHVTNGR
ncbi:transmembrane protein 214-B-like [Mizuhopecten yessoensis]|uniref:Transmembrane protein 214A n=1 Tax=Mizuhopecten yessoensis TaxID=6573 RepID=A0A210PGD7_MIZYE|nr:transmembrane protein 214-B-like [Mizuhopecten yessoensis]OWF35521.1 Transmembrane protein 214A [Mizuhopecten yessoensis]